MIQSKNLTAKNIEAELEALSTPEKRAFLPSFFKTGKGQYGEGDRFLGVVVPNTRKVVKSYRSLPFEEIIKLLNNPFHECRLCALLILTARAKNADERTRKEIFDFYLAHTQRINNWDLVDLSCREIVGEYLVDKERMLLLKEMILKIFYYSLKNFYTINMI